MKYKDKKSTEYGQIFFEDNLLLYAIEPQIDAGNYQKQPIDCFFYNPADIEISFVFIYPDIM